MLPEARRGRARCRASRRAIVVATEPTELVVSDGEPKWTPVGERQAPVRREHRDALGARARDQQIYVLLSGRWFRAARTERPLDLRAGRPAAADLREDPGRFGHRRRARVGGRHRRSRRRRARRRDPEDDRDQPQRGEARRRSTRASPKFEKIPSTSVSQAVNTPAQVLQIGVEVLRRRQRRLVRVHEPEGAVGGGGLRARGPDPADPAELLRVQHDLRARLPVDAAGRLRRLHAGLHVVVPVLRRARLRHGLLLPAVPGLLLPAPVHLRLPRRATTRGPAGTSG